MTIRECSDRKIEVLKQVIQVGPEVSSRQIADQDARVLRFTREEIGSPIEKTEVVLVSERCGWDIALTAPFGDRASYRDLFDAFLASFRFLAERLMHAGKL
jgi:hypothetical protein